MKGVVRRGVGCDAERRGVVLRYLRRCKSAFCAVSRFVRLLHKGRVRVKEAAMCEKLRQLRGRKTILGIPSIRKTPTRCHFVHSRRQGGCNGLIYLRYKRAVPLRYKYVSRFIKRILSRRKFRVSRDQAVFCKCYSDYEELGG